MKNLLEKHNLYLDKNGDEFKFERYVEFERYVKFEMKFFIGKDELNLNPGTIEELEEVIEIINKKNKDRKVSFFLISKEDDIASDNEKEKIEILPTTKIKKN